MDGDNGDDGNENKITCHKRHLEESKGDADMNTDHTVGDDQDLGELCKNCALVVFVLMVMRLLVMVKMVSFYDNANDFFIGHMVPLPSLQGPPAQGAPAGGGSLTSTSL